MVREFEDLPGENLLLVFDPMLPDLLSDFEAAVSLAATIAAEWRSDRGGRLIAVVAGPDAVMLDGPCGPLHARRVLEALAVVEPLPSQPADGGLLARLTAVRCAAVVVVGAGPGRLADVLRKALQRPVVSLNAAVLRGLDFYEPPDESPLPSDHS